MTTRSIVVLAERMEGIGGVIDEKRNGDTDDGNEVRNGVGCVDNGCGCGVGGRRDFGEG